MELTTFNKCRSRQRICSSTCNEIGTIMVQHRHVFDKHIGHIISVHVGRFIIA